MKKEKAKINGKGVRSQKKYYPINKIITSTKRYLKDSGLMKSKNLHGVIDASLKAVKRFKKLHKKSKIATRIIPLPVNGGSLSLVPIYACLASVGVLGSENASDAIVDAINATNKVRRELHNKINLGENPEPIMLEGSKGAGMYIAPHKHSEHCFGIYFTAPQYNLPKNW